MGILIGMDEAGYGPNLGPLVVTATVWRVPGLPSRFDLWDALDRSVTRSPGAGDRRLHIDDSKQVYSPSRGVAALERSVLSGLSMCGARPRSFDALCSRLNPLWARVTSADSEPWFEAAELPLPMAQEFAQIDGLSEHWRACCQSAGVELLGVRSDIVLTGRFNSVVQDLDNKSAALTRFSLDLLRQVWNPDDDEETLVVADKHGGRNRYGEFLSELLDDRLILGQEESRRVSRYRIGRTAIHFESRSESHLPVAFASMVCKYVRELAMELFNRFWRQHVPGIKPTAGYPVDAARFHREIAAAQQRLQIPDRVLWRCR